MYFKSRKLLMKDINDSKILPRLVTYPLPAGTVCNVFTSADGKSNIINGASHVIDDPLSTAIIKAGISGFVVIVNSKDHSRSRNGSKWLSYNLSYLSWDLWKDDIIIYSLGNEPTCKNDLNIKLIKPIVSDTKTVLRLNKTQSSEDPTYDGMVIMAKDRLDTMSMYRILPSRKITGIVVSVTPESDGESLSNFIVKVNYEGNDYLILTNITTHYNRITLAPRVAELIGKTADVSYTSFIPGNRIANFASPLLSNIKNL